MADWVLHWSRTYSVVLGISKNGKVKLLAFITYHQIILQPVQNTLTYRN